MGEGTVQFRRKKAFATLYREVAQDERLSLESRGPVSYTHLDVYKRQSPFRARRAAR